MGGADPCRKHFPGTVTSWLLTRFSHSLRGTDERLERGWGEARAFLSSSPYLRQYPRQWLSLLHNSRCPHVNPPSVCGPCFCQAALLWFHLPFGDPSSWALVTPPPPPLFFHSLGWWWLLAVDNLWFDFLFCTCILGSLKPL